MRRILIWSLVLIVALSLTAFADQKITSNSQVDMAISFTAQQYDNYVVTIPAEVTIENSFSGSFTVTLDVDDSYNWHFSFVNLDVSYNDSYEEWLEEDGSANRGYRMTNGQGDSVTYWLTRSSDGKQLWPENLDDTDYAAKQFENSVSMVDDMQSGYWPSAFQWSMGKDEDVERHISEEIEIACQGDLTALAAGEYTGSVTFNVYNGPIDDDYTLLTEYDTILDRHDSDDCENWTYTDNNGRYVWDEENWCLKEAS